MPPRWLLPKTRVPHDETWRITTQPGKTETVQTPKWDDFCFGEDIPPIRDAQQEDRPKTSSGVSGRYRSKSKTRPQIGLSLTRPKTSEGRPPSTNYASSSSSKLEEGMIGVAFGSPTHPPTTFFGSLNDFAPPSTYEESVFEQAEPMYQIKGQTSKWKKLGFLFKGNKGAADKDDMFEVPFYQVRMGDEPPEPEVKPPVWKQGETAGELPARRSPTPPTKNNPRRSIDARLAQARLEVARLEEAIAEVEKKAAEQAKASLDDASRPKLDLVIPDIRMDRLSVMFADLTQIPPNSKLLARRSKKVDCLKPISMQDMKHIDEITTPDTGTLSPRLAVPRRATSPSAAKTTAGFSLFPAATLAPNYIAKHTLATRSPRTQLRRSVTSPARLSPKAETFGTEKTKFSQPPRTESSNAVISPGDTTASTDREAPWSAEAFLSPTSTVTTIDEDILLSPAKDRKFEEPEEQWPDANEAQHIQFTTGDTPEANTPVTSVDPSQEDDYRVQRVASSVFDAAIAEIEAFGVPSLKEQPPLPSPPSAYVPFLLAPDVNEQDSTNTIEKPPLVISKSRFMMMNMPSPITEAPEESPAPSPAKVTPGASKPAGTGPLSEVTVLPQISEPPRPAPPAPIMLEKPPARRDKTMLTTLPEALPGPVQEVLEENPKSSLEKQRQKEQEKPRVPPKPSQNSKTQDVQTSPAQPRSQSYTAQKEIKQELQTSPPKNAPRSNSRQRTSDKAARVLGEVLPVHEHQMALITGRPTDAALSSTDSPPAVPTKDSKFVLPLSRFAVKGTAADVTQRSGLKASPRPATPSKPTRSATEPLTTEHMNTSYPKSKPSRLTRSASDESLQKDITNPQAKGAATSNLSRMGMEKPSVTTVMAIVKPVPVTPGGEVGVARTISLSRKTSQRILVKRNDNTRDTSAEAKEERAKQPQARYEQNQMAVVRPPRSSSRPNRPMDNLRRSESFKRAIEVGMSDDEVGDMKSGELRARAMSPEMHQVMTGLMVNGHKVMKSSAGVIEDAL